MKNNKEMKIIAPNGCEIDKINIVDGIAVVTFREQKQKLPKSWEEFCEIFPIKDGECLIDNVSDIVQCSKIECVGSKRSVFQDANLLPDRATAEAVLALCMLIQLRNCYNGDWVPDWDGGGHNYVIEFDGGDIDLYDRDTVSSSPLYFKTEELRDEFLRNFRPLIEKLKPLYGIKEGGEE